MPLKRVRIDLTASQLMRLRGEVLHNPQLSGEQRRKVARTLIPFPSTGAPVDLFFEGKFVAVL